MAVSYTHLDVYKRQERTGAELSFANAGDPFLTADERPDRSGAIVEAIWPAAALVVPRGVALGENQQFE